MSYFLPSFFQKRILRYALSRLELLDTDALDLEKLEIGWGRRSTVELRDVGLHTEKLSSLLKLPRSLALVSAQLLFLRLTIPADLYRSGIVVEAQGLRVHIEADLDEQKLAQSTPQRARRERPAKASRGFQADKPRTSQSHVHDPGGTSFRETATTTEEGNNGPVGDLPTTTDLARSFLQTEPKEEKDELQASVTQSQYLGHSMQSNEAGVIGVGNNFSLPAFLADFLKGVGDRIQLKAQDVEVDLTLRVDRSSNSSQGSDASDRIEDVTVRLNIGRIGIDGISISEQTFRGLTGQESQAAATHETRRVTLSNIEVTVISEASLFADLARSTASPSPETHTRSMAKACPASDSMDSTEHGPLNDGLDGNLHPSQSQDLGFAIVGDQLGVLHTTRTENKEIQAQVQKHDVRKSEYQERVLASPQCSSRSSSRDEQRFLRDEPIQDLESSHEPSELHHPVQRQRRPGEITSLATSGLFVSASTPDQAGAAHYMSASQIQRDPSTRIFQQASDGSSPNSDQSSPGSEDLAESKIFTHEEASMYMSAISNLPARKEDQSSLVPGTWDPASWVDEAEGEAPYRTSQTSKSIRRDNEKSSQPCIPSSGSSQPSSTGDAIGNSSAISQARSTGNDIISCPIIDSAESKSFASPPKEASSPTQGSEVSSANSKTSFTVSKTIMSIDLIRVVLPLGSGREETTLESRNQWDIDSSQKAPGGFGQASGSDAAKSLGSPSKTSKINKDHHNRLPYSIDVGKIQVLGDMGLTKMLVLVIEHLNTIRRSCATKTVNHETPEPSEGQDRELRLVVKTIRWNFLDVVTGIPLWKHPRDPLGTDTECSSGGSEILLRADVENFRIVQSNTGVSSTTRIAMGKFSFGYRMYDVLSFDSNMKMRESTRDILAPTDDDVILIITQSHETLKADLTTLPLHVALDLRRLDETFSWFGGFSSMLDLGSSMMSTITVVDNRSKAAHTGKHKRGVRFENSPPSRLSEAGSNNVQNKVTARIGGFIFDLQGTQSSLRFESTAMKIISRAEGLGLQVDRLRLKGPDLKRDSSDSPVTVYLTNLRIEYLSTPKEVDLTRLLALLSPSKAKDARDDDILLETLLRQRRQGAVVRATVESLESNVSHLDHLHYFPLLAEELKKLSTVAKYLPEDDRPGVLALLLIKDFRLAISVNDRFGIANFRCKNIEGVHVTFPTLMALGINTIHLHRNGTEELLGLALPPEVDSGNDLPTVMARFVGNEMEPTVKIKIHGLRLDYHVSTIMAIMGLSDIADTETVLAEMIGSVASVTSQPASTASASKLPEQGYTSSNGPALHSRVLKLDVALCDTIIGLNPHQSSANGLLIFTETHLLISRPKTEEINATLEIKKASIMIINDFDNVVPLATKAGKTKRLDSSKSQVEYLSDMGYVSVGSVSAANTSARIVALNRDKSKAAEVEIRDVLLVLETCADSTQTLQNILNGLKPPIPASDEAKYITEVVPIEDILASFTGDAFATTTNKSVDEDPPLGLDEGDMVDDEVPQNLEFVSSFYDPEPDKAYDSIADSILEDDLESIASPSIIREIGDKNMLQSFQDQAQVAPGNARLQFQEGHFGATSATQEIARRWNIGKNSSEWKKDYKISGSPLRCQARNVHIIWNLYDGYDWQRTRDTISQAVEDVQNKAMERMAGKDKRNSLDPDVEEQSVIGDFLFNSIYISIPANHDPRDLTRQVNRNLDDLVSESEGFATSTTSSPPSRQGQPTRPKGRKLKLNRSRSHKMTFELKGVSADVVVAPPGSGETQSSIDIRVQDLEIFDHVPTSTWKKFATYMHDAGERQMGTSMVHLEILNVKPVPHLAASEIILKATILPIRLHVDQDALDFMTRFFEFKDDAAVAPTSKSEPPFLQRVEVSSVQVKLDFKPKRVDYTGIRSGHTTEFMNFFILDRADMVLRHVIIYGVSGFDKLGKTLNDIWMPDIKRNQLPGILAGLAPVRSLVNVGGGVRDLVVVPIREYQKDGRVVRSLQKGAVAFAKTTTNELVKLGAKLAIGTQTVLQGAENLLSQPSATRSDVPGGWEDAELDAEEKEQISHYADQPVGVIQGLRGGYASLERDLLLAKDAIIAMPGEVLESGTAGGAAKAVLKNAPTVILRPAMGVSKAVGQTLMGATNSLDPENRRRVEEKYKRH